MIASSRLELTAYEARALVDRRLAQITPEQQPVRAPGQRPLAMLIGGPPGSGKSTTQWLLQASLGPGTVAVYDFDDDITAHPRYDAIMRARGILAADDIARSLPPGMIRRCLEHLRRGTPQYDVIASAPLHRPELARGWVDGFRDVDYRVALVYVVTHEANCRLGRAGRYQQAVDDTGIGRWVPPERGRLAYRLVPGTAQTIESESSVDDLYIVDRDGYVWYESHRGADGLIPEPWLAEQQILALRNLPPTPAEDELFHASAQPLLDRSAELPQWVVAEVEAAVTQHEARGRPQSHGLVLPGRLDERLTDLRRITGAGLAAPSATPNPDAGAGAGPGGAGAGSRPGAARPRSVGGGVREP
ncbi:hypothetical protein GCM10009630_59210 [Kribbella jejuensis]|uniref:UDP-N-acetylglucosamine kinase n=1 Tax=Kribbella jejuensis TaxID=236068 RepID=A0A542EN14_9ACTN|nr:zeta toxin family protein [Kribbella jejuensis]TQJ16738.1 zeta toxin [Kribbella jejuensis]